MEPFVSRFEALTGHRPFPWQEVLFDRLVAGDLPIACSIPTGMGKTSAIAVWLVALATRAETGLLRGFPRRLVYVVNRRTVVDQATADVETWRQRMNVEPALADTRDALRRLAVCPQSDAFAISTLRGQRADNAEWRADPARPAVVIGTVDMIGSRLLFGGYGCGFRSKPLHAGFLGQDVWLVHDEAHLEPAFQQLVTAVRAEQQASGDIRPFFVTALTATSRDGDVDFRLTGQDLRHEAVAARVHARKALGLYHVEPKALVDAVVERVLAHRNSGQAILVYLRTVEDVDKVCDRLREAGLTVEQLTGTLRGLERDRFVVENRVFRRFAAGDSAVAPAPGTVCLVCTSAGEVGVNMSADHMVCDLTPFDSMAQRLGRVNRFGNGAALVDVVVAGLPGGTDTGSPGAPEDPYAAARARTAGLLSKLPVTEATVDGIERHDASPAALEALPPDARRDAFTPAPVTLATSDILFDKWALTTIREKLSGRPPVHEWLHGVAPWDPPETMVAWRLEVEKITGPLLDEHPPDDLLELYPLKPHELLRDRSDRVFAHLREIAAREPEKPVWLIDDENPVEVLTFRSLIEKGAAALAHCTVLLPPSAGGLAIDQAGRSTGRLSGRTRAEQAEDESLCDVADLWVDERGEPRRRRVWNDDPVPEGMRLVRTIAIEKPSGEGIEEPEIDVWRWFTRPAHADDEGSRAASREQSLGEHLTRAEAFAAAFASRLELDETEASAVCAAARMHDLGKARAIWQRSIRNLQYPEKVLAKSGNSLPLHVLSSYRHELGSVIDIGGNPEFRALSPAAQDLVLHLVAAHHGRARPGFPGHEVYDPERLGEEASAAARDAMIRYGRLQQRYGRWGLAFLESLVRAVDVLASNSDIPLPPAGDSMSKGEPSVSAAGAPAVIESTHTFSVNVNLRNPGEFLACCGLLEVAHRLAPGAQGWFDGDAFRVRADTGLRDVVHALIREEAEELTRLKGGLTVPPLIAPLAIRLADAQRETLVLDGWMTVRVEKGKVVAGPNRPWNFWSGQQTSLRIWRSLRAALQEQITRTGDLLGEDLFTRRVPLSGRFGFDPGAAWNALDVGFSPNEQGIDVASSPAVELLAAVGLQRFRPVVADDRETFWYSTWSTPLVPCVAAAACTGLLDAGGHRFRGIVVSRGSYAALGVSIPDERTPR